MEWISVEEQMPQYGQPVLVFCKKASYKHDGLKLTVAAYQTAKEIYETSDYFDDESEAEDGWVAEVSLFDSDYGGRWMNEEVTHWMPLPEPPKN
ncbi:DUF551 domain-containing protein [Acinetobacter lactucae]|uniref:DUF551 domain-containing protein n=1 Tax=Acinetobacter lactucae TaxID=1785128 RepID=UPI0015F448D9|nr:DUF551 domain-containing protein [Acinetobacter lactucae]